MSELDPALKPRLKEGLRFETGSGTSIINVVDVSGHQHQMYEIECLIAREMDGTRTIQDLTRIARRFMGTIRLEQMEKLVRQLAGMGLIYPLAYTADLLEDAGDTKVAPVPIPGMVVPTSDEAWEIVEPPPDDDDDDELESVAAVAVVAPAMLEPRKPSEIAPPSSPGVLWQPQELSWHQRPLVRKLRVPALLLALIALLSFVEYPLYVTEECLVLSAQRSHVRAQIDGLLFEILIDEGQQVKKGDVVARLDPRETETALDQAKAEVGRLTANLDKQRRGARPEEVGTARAALAAAQRDLGFARREAQRKAELFKQGVTSAEQRDLAMRELEVKRSAATQAEAELKLVQAGFRKEEVAMAEAELRRAEVEVRHLEERQKLLTIVAPVDGQVTTPRFKERLHEHVATGELICEVVDARWMDVEVFVPEREIDSVAIGQPVFVKVASYPLHPMEGKVTFIAPAVSERHGERVVRVLTEIENSDGILREGMSGYGEIDAGKKSLMSLALRRVVRWVRVRFLI